MSLLRLDNIYLELGGKKLLTDASFALEHNERICLIGRNGAGKSSLIKLILGDLHFDKGEMVLSKHASISQLAQKLPPVSEQKVFEYVKQGLASQQSLIDQFHVLSKSNNSAAVSERLHALEGRIEHAGGWNLDHLVQAIIDKMQLPADKAMHQLSGGWRRRVDLAKAFVAKPDILLLDEPTNHLDLNTITWLEDQLHEFAGSLIFVSHDRTFVNSLATRILEIDRGQLVSWTGNYQDYLRLKAQSNEAEDKANELFDKRLAEEEAWIRKGIKARRTRNEGRVRALEGMREQAEQRIKRVAQVSIAQQQAAPCGKDVVVAHKVNLQLGAQQLIKQFSIKIRRGDKIALVGNNGVGKTTLLKLLLGQLQPDSGTVKLGANLAVGYFDQTENTHAIDPEKSVLDNINGGSSYVSINGRERHIVGYLKDFLFSPEASFTKAKSLSGGERNRLMLAKLFAKQYNLLVLDEPTNDLDIEMVQAIEKYLINYDGTLLLVSHDRNFIDNIVDSIIVFEADGVKQYTGGYDDWVQRGASLQTADSLAPTSAVLEGNVAKKTASIKQLSQAEKKELKAVLRSIEKLEQEIAKLQQITAQVDFYQQPVQKQQELFESIKDKKDLLDNKMLRWSELEEG